MDVLLEARPTRSGGAVVLAASTDSVDAASSRLRSRVLLAIALGLLAALAAALVMARRLGAPLATTAAAARRLAAGERGVDLPEDRTQEVADVAEALRHLDRHLDRALTASEQRQRQFLLSVSHELRTPLTTVRGYAEALADGAVEVDELPWLGRTLLAESERLEGYVEELLALARLEADDFTLHVEPVDLAALVEDTVAVWQERARRHGVELSAAGCADGAALVETDAGRVRQVLDALLDNAVRVCDAGARVVLAVRRTGGGCGSRCETPGRASPTTTPRSPSSRAPCTRATPAPDPSATVWGSPSWSG